VRGTCGRAPEVRRERTRRARRQNPPIRPHARGASLLVESPSEHGTNALGSTCVAAQLSFEPHPPSRPSSADDA
jgi:hypothetical protein